MSCGTRVSVSVDARLRSIAWPPLVGASGDAISCRIHRGALSLTLGAPGRLTLILKQAGARNNVDRRRPRDGSTKMGNRQVHQPELLPVSGALNCHLWPEHVLRDADLMLPLALYTSWRAGVR